MITIIPMAGLGSRFSNDGYLLPKPLIPVSGKPMITQVIRDLPASDKHTFIVRQEHVDTFAIDTLIKATLPSATILPINYTTDGQATTCMLGLDRVSDEEEVFISACDNSFLYNEAAFNALRGNPSVDCIVWTFTKDPLLTAKPEAWGWIKLGADGKTIEDMSVKVPVSDDPFHDHAVVATFWFRRAGDFKAAYAAMVAADYRTNNEFYVDNFPIFMNQLGKKSVIFPVDLYVGWGKPADLHLYDKHEYDHTVDRETDPRWNAFFKKAKSQ
jgi:molybdopterin-guanine dinucleotide biosynthesis protein A